MGGNINVPASSNVVGIPTNDVSGLGSSSTSSWLDPLSNIFGNKNIIGGQEHGTTYLDPTTGQLMISAFGPDKLAPQSAYKPWNANPANANSKVTFDPYAKQPVLGGYGDMLQLGLAGLGEWTNYGMYQEAKRNNAFNKDLKSYQVNASTQAYNDNIDSYNKKQGSLAAKKAMYSAPGTVPKYKKRAKLEAFNA